MSANIIMFNVRLINRIKEARYAYIQACLSWKMEKRNWIFKLHKKLSTERKISTI
jgi:hypothetical protein